jgi:ribosomal protein S18 acetylase RimI-like enzyme
MWGLSLGWRTWGGRISLRIGRRLSRQPSAARFHVHYVDLLKAPLPGITTGVPITWETAYDLADVEACVRDLPIEYRSDVGDRLAQRHWCLVGKCNGVVAHAAWAGIGTFKAHWFDRWFRLQPGDAYLYGAYTLPAFRGLHIHPASAIERLRQARERGIQRVYWFVDPANRAARQLPARVGAVRIGTAGYVAGIRLHYLTDFGHLTRSNPRLLLVKR